MPAQRPPQTKPAARPPPVGARLAREPDTTVFLVDRVIVLRGQASLLQAKNERGITDTPQRLVRRQAWLLRENRASRWVRWQTNTLPRPFRHRASAPACSARCAG
ncbi:hypothetical protein PSUM_14715 [Pseudomonas umsongensis]|uniref:Uncharacterized protein n=1 Tax=Pseudomonas umsongensis TaxID=198618 RepID=A0ABX4DXA3_9PSED|nr:hypothetical protein PSUM_14715 [Pseudomonas umsongensis]